MLEYSWLVLVKLGGEPSNLTGGGGYRRRRRGSPLGHSWHFRQAGGRKKEKNGAPAWGKQKHVGENEMWHISRNARKLKNILQEEQQVNNRDHIP